MGLSAHMKNTQTFKARFDACLYCVLSHKLLPELDNRVPAGCIVCLFFGSYPGVFSKDVGSIIFYRVKVRNLCRRHEILTCWLLKHRNT